MLAGNIIDTVSGYIPLNDFKDSGGLNSATAGDDCSDSEAASRTIRALALLCNFQAQKRLKVDMPSFIIILDSPSLTSQTRSADEGPSLELVKDFTKAARSAGPARACSSVLAGHSSESDEYADVGILIPADAVDIDPSSHLEKNAKAVLLSLGLDSLLSSEIMPLSLSEETKAPVAFRACIDDADVQHLASLLGTLSHRFAFSVRVEDVVFHFLLGQVPEGSFWAGLLGVGTWSD